VEIVRNSRTRGWQEGGTYAGKEPETPKALNARVDNSSYRKFVQLRSQKRVMLRFLQEGDRQDLLSLFQAAPEKDLRFCNHDLKDLKLLNHWLDHSSSPRLIPLVAVDVQNNQLIAAATMLRGKRSANHIGEIKLFIAEPFRNLGLGSKILDELVLLASRENLHWMKAEVVTDQKQMIKALRNKGFQVRANLEDYFLRKDGMTHDVALMMRPVKEETDEL
jgi:L-amino acid N-acyltransferase YncA